MNYHAKAWTVYRAARKVKELHDLFLEIAEKNPKALIEAWDRLHPKAKPEVPPALVKGPQWFISQAPPCAQCGAYSVPIGINGNCAICDPAGMETSNLTEAAG